MTTSTSYEMNEPRVVCETMDGEVVAIDLDTSSYFSTNQTAAVIWNAIAEGLPVNAVIETLHKKFENVAADVDQQVDAFVKQLIDESLIRERTNPASSSTGAANESVTAYAPPVLEKYDDMQELLQADPVHDVETISWPAESSKES